VWWRIHGEGGLRIRGKEEMIILNFLINRDKFGDRSNRMDNMDNMVVLKLTET